MMMKFHQVVASCLLIACLPMLSRADTLKAVVTIEVCDPGSQAEVHALALTAINQMNRRALQESSRTLRGSTQRSALCSDQCDTIFCRDIPHLCDSLCDTCSRRELVSSPMDDHHEDHLKHEDMNEVKDEESSNALKERRKLSTSDLIGPPCNFKEITGEAKRNLMKDANIPQSEENCFKVYESTNVNEPECSKHLS